MKGNLCILSICNGICAKKNLKSQSKLQNLYISWDPAVCDDIHPKVKELREITLMGKFAYKEIIEHHIIEENLSKATNAVSHYSFWSKEVLKSDLSCCEKMKYWLKYKLSM
eukprot:NODE_912_length_3098_cov_0.494832.p3 type:complete len:111 gc:universal NODE_912_length_3098_cov_0.494832:1833-1501(-)